MGRTLEERINGAEAEPWIPEEAGEYVVGEIEEISAREGDYGPYKVLTLLTDKGDVLSVAGFGTVLKGKFDSLTDPEDIGRTIAVKFLGEARGKSGKDYKNWQVTLGAKASVPVGGGDFSEDDDI
jgi:hypothetical protein